MAPSTDPFILIVEDDPDHSALIEAAFKKSLAHAKTHLVLSGWEARVYLASVVSRKYMDIMTGIEYVAPHPLGGGRSHGPGTSVEAARGQWEHP